jgi:hypothetical protein
VDWRGTEADIPHIPCAFEGDFPSHRGALHRNSITSDSADSQIVGSQPEALEPKLFSHFPEVRSATSFQIALRGRGSSIGLIA